MPARGLAFGTMVTDNGGRRVAVSYDGQLSSPALEAALAEGLADTGLEVTRIGRGPTPMLYFAVHHLDLDGGMMMVTGSHNPPDHNGFKMMLGTAAFFGADFRHPGEIAAAGNFRRGSEKIAGAPMLAAYVDRIAPDYTATSGPAVAWDVGIDGGEAEIAALAARLAAAGTEVSDIDGVRIRTGDGWWLLRASNTQDILG
jgi:phosphomannomutase